MSPICAGGSFTKSGASPIYVRQEVCRVSQQIRQKHVRFAELDGPVTAQGVLRLKVVVHPSSMTAEAVAVP